LLAINLWLLLSGLPQALGVERGCGAGLSVGAYHAHLADLYYSTGTVYDLLCGALFLGALV
jgi:hypothetical protein